MTSKEEALMKFWLGMMLMAALLIGAPGYGRAEPPGKDSTSPATRSENLEKQGDQARTGKSYTSKEKQDYLTQVAVNLDKIQQGIEDLKVKGRTVIQQRKRMVLKGLINLQNMANGARNKLAGLEKAPENAWSGLKAEMDKTMQELAKTYKEVEAQVE